MARATWDGILNATNHKLRPFLLSRSFYTGSQKYGAIWTGDSAATWEHLQISVAMMNSLSICGIDFCGSDVGGFFGNPDMELLSRWYQLGTLQPFFRAHSHIESNRREPYLIEDPYGSIIKTTISFRYRLLAYWYLCFWLAESNNEPVTSPVWIYYNDFLDLNNDDMYMIGTEILARPIVTRDCKFISVVLPGRRDSWFQYCHISATWQMYFGSSKITIPISLASFPIFYRGGSCIFMKDEFCANSVDWQKSPYYVYVFPAKYRKSSGILYIDDYSTYAYQNDKQYIVFRLTFDPVGRCLICEKEQGIWTNTSFIYSKIASIIIIKNKLMLWNDYNTISVQGKPIDNCVVTHFDDRIEISNLNLDIMVDCVMLFGM